MRKAITRKRAMTTATVDSAMGPPETKMDDYLIEYFGGE
jgi:hypothetical protein